MGQSYLRLRSPLLLVVVSYRIAMFRFALGFMLGFYVATLAAEKILSTTGGVPSIDHLVQMALTALHLQ